MSGPLDAAASGSGLSFHTRTDDANGNQSLLMNGYLTATGVQPMQADKMVWLLELGGSQGLRISGFDPAGSSDEIPFESFIDFGGFKVAPLSGHRNEVAFQPPARSTPPSFRSGDYWIGSLYYDTTADKLRVNTGGSTWVDLHSATVDASSESFSRSINANSTKDESPFSFRLRATLGRQ